MWRNLLTFYTSKVKEKPDESGLIGCSWFQRITFTIQY